MSLGSCVVSVRFASTWYSSSRRTLPGIFVVSTSNGTLAPALAATETPPSPTDTLKPGELAEAGADDGVGTPCPTQFAPFATCRSRSCNVWARICFFSPNS